MSDVFWSLFLSLSGSVSIGNVVADVIRSSSVSKILVFSSSKLLVQISGVTKRYKSY